MSESRQFQAFIETWRGQEELDFMSDDPMPMFLISSLRRELLLHRSSPPDHAIYQISTHCIPGGPLFVEGTEYDAIDEPALGTQVDFVFNTGHGQIPILAPVEAADEDRDCFTRFYESPDVTKADVEDLAIETIKKLAQTN